MISFLERRKLDTSQKIRYFQQAASLVTRDSTLTLIEIEQSLWSRVHAITQRISQCNTLTQYGCSAKSGHVGNAETDEAGFGGFVTMTLGTFCKKDQQL